MRYIEGSAGRRGPLASILPWLLAWLALAAIVGVLTARENVAAGFAASARATTGIVTAIESNNHATVRARFEVNGLTYEVADSFIGPPNPGFDAVRVGDRVTVYYDPRAPATAVLSDPGRRASNEVGFAILAAIVLPTGFIGVLLLSLLVRSGLRRVWAS